MVVAGVCAAHRGYSSGQDVCQRQGSPDDEYFLSRPTLIEKLQLVVNKTNVKRRIMDNDLGVPNKVDKIGRDVAKTRLVREELIADTVNVQSSWVDASIGLQILMKAALRQATVDNFPATNLNNPMALQRIEPSGFGV